MCYMTNSFDFVSSSFLVPGATFSYGLVGFYYCQVACLVFFCCFNMLFVDTLISEKKNET
jgi:hypothetical protein